MNFYLFVLNNMQINASESIGDRIFNLEVQRLILLAIVILLIALIVMHFLIKKQDREITEKTNTDSINSSNLSSQCIIEAFIKGQDEERMRISKELHDGVCSGLAGVRFLIEPYTYENDDLKKAGVWLQSIHTDLRYISHNLASKEVFDFGLSDALELLASRLGQTNGVQFNFQSNFDEKISEITLNIQQNAYRIVQEILINILKHSHAKTINLGINFTNDFIEIEIIDNATNCEIKKGNGLGLDNITSRVEFLKGKIEINTSEMGTYYSISLPNKCPHTSNPSTVISSV